MATPFAETTVTELAGRLHARRQLVHRLATTCAADASRALEDLDVSDLLDGDDPDGGSNEVDRAHALALAGLAQRAAADVEAALERLANGEYGRCQACGGRIPLARLRAVPETTVCVTCKSAAGWPVAMAG
jgi:RNA polymerase-binding transcription factor DksA